MANWSRDEQLVALRLYLTEPFGRLHKTNPRIMKLAEALGTRSASALSMKACNFASLDPTFVKSGRRGLSGASEADRALWAEFESSRNEVVSQMEALIEPTLPEDVRAPRGDSEAVRSVTVRRHQRCFRDEVKAAYGGRCAVTGLDVPELLVASHIIPWAESPARRTDATNGLLLNALFDRAFDRGLISFDDARRLLCAKSLKRKKSAARRMLLDHEGSALRTPERAPAALDALRWHRENCFDG